MEKYKWVIWLILISAAGWLLQNCSESLTDPVESETSNTGFQKVEASFDMEKNITTGTVEIIWKGGNGNNQEVEPKRAFAEITALQAYDEKPVRGEFIYRVMTEDLIVKREIIAEVHKVHIGAPNAWIVARVISDSKGCSGGDTPDGHSEDCPGRTSGGEASGHDEGCGGEDSGGGCSGGDHADGGCDHSDGETGGGGCAEDHTDGSDCAESTTDEETEDGCSDNAGGTEGGCEHTDSETGTGCSGEDQSAGGPGGNSSNPKGNTCRVEQRVFIMINDGGTPGVNGDLIAWKWFYKNSANKPVWDNFDTWHLCLKTIIGGNLIIHTK